MRLEVFPEIGSTNTEGMARLAAGERGPLWLRAERQTTGRGRDGRAWSSPAGNLSASLVQQLFCAPTAASQLSLVAGVALIAALGAIAPAVPCRLKWPNDVLVGDAKLAGILVECTVLAAAKPGTRASMGAVIGFGVNLATAPDLTDRASTALSQHGVTCAPADFLTVLARQLNDWFERWNGSAGFPLVRERWLAAGPELGTMLTVRGTTTPCCGQFAGLDHDGALLLIGDTGVVQRITFGDVESMSAARSR
jgi:BirA family transcriptional regulator, biotin operon repressor / biotin---[acetyl-CoA-carboxylase] ligase